jgi:hypothetical protein
MHSSSEGVQVNTPVRNLDVRPTGFIPVEEIG